MWVHAIFLSNLLSIFCLSQFMIASSDFCRLCADILQIHLTPHSTDGSCTPDRIPDSKKRLPAGLSRIKAAGDLMPDSKTLCHKESRTPCAEKIPINLAHTARRFCDTIFISYYTDIIRSAAFLVCEIILQQKIER